MVKLINEINSSVSHFLIIVVISLLFVMPPLAFSQVNKKAVSADLNSLTPESSVATHIKMMGSLEPLRSREPTVIYTWFSGHLWAVIPGTPAKPLVSFDGLAKTVWRVDGDQVTQQSYDVGFFGDIDTGEVIDVFKNPYTGKTVRPYHYAYGGGITRYTKTGILLPDGKIKPINHQWTISGDKAWFEEKYSASATNPLNPSEWPLASAGKKIHYGSSTTNVARLDDLLDSSQSTIPYTLFWTSIGPWEPWLHMGDTPGFIMWRATGRKLADLSEAPKRIIDYIKKVQPNYFEDDKPWPGKRSTTTDYQRDRKPESVAK